jgi:hypothetical protein
MPQIDLRLEAANTAQSRARAVDAIAFLAATDHLRVNGLTPAPVQTALVRQFELPNRAPAVFRKHLWVQAVNVGPLNQTNTRRNGLTPYGHNPFSHEWLEEFQENSPARCQVSSNRADSSSSGKRAGD